MYCNYIKDFHNSLNLIQLISGIKIFRGRFSNHKMIKSAKIIVVISLNSNALSTYLCGKYGAIFFVCCFANSPKVQHNGCGDDGSIIQFRNEMPVEEKIGLDK